MRILAAIASDQRGAAIDLKRHLVAARSRMAPSVTQSKKCDRHRLSPLATRSGYRSGSAVASKKTSLSGISEQQIQVSLEAIILRRPAKAVSTETGFPIAIINKWRCYGLPKWLVDGFAQTVRNTSLWAEAKRLRMIADVAQIDHEIQRLQALRKGMANDLVVESAFGRALVRVRRALPPRRQVGTGGCE